MTPRFVRLDWGPPLLLGVALAGSGEITATLLLYSDQGFLRALSVVLFVELGALAAGLWSVAGLPAESLLTSTRRRWLLLLVALSLAATFSTAWSVLNGFDSSALVQGLGLALMAGLPLFAGGAVLGSVIQLAETGTEGAAGRSVGVVSAACIGGALGFAVTGALLIPRLTPASILLLGVMAASGGALIQGEVLAARLRSAEEVDEGGPP